MRFAIDASPRQDPLAGVPVNAWRGRTAVVAAEKTNATTATDITAVAGQDKRHRSMQPYHIPRGTAGS